MRTLDVKGRDPLIELQNYTNVSSALFHCFLIPNLSFKSLIF